MELISTFQLEEDVSEKINDLEIENQTIKKHLTVFTDKERVQSMEESSDVTVRGVDKNEVTTANISESYELNDSDATLFVDTIQRGGYVILQDGNKEEKSKNTQHKKEPAREDEDETGDFEKAVDDHLSAPGFGVDFKEPGTDAETHEDNFNPDNHNEEKRVDE